MGLTLFDKDIYVFDVFWLYVGLFGWLICFVFACLNWFCFCLLLIFLFVDGGVVALLVCWLVSDLSFEFVDLVLIWDCLWFGYVDVFWYLYFVLFCTWGVVFSLVCGFAVCVCLFKCCCFAVWVLGLCLVSLATCDFVYGCLFVWIAICICLYCG